MSPMVFFLAVEEIGIYRGEVGGGEHRLLFIVYIC